MLLGDTMLKSITCYLSLSVHSQAPSEGVSVQGGHWWGEGGGVALLELVAATEAGGTHQTGMLFVLTKEQF